MKKLIAILLVITLLIMLAGCGLPLSQSESGGDTIQSSQETVAPTITGSHESTDVVPEASAEPELPPVRAIVFDKTIDDPFAARFGNPTVAQGKATLSLTLFETEPGIFTGEGTLFRSQKMNMESSMSFDSKRRLYFKDIIEGDSGHLVMLNHTDYRQDLSMGENLGFLEVRRLITNQSAFDYKLSLDGDSAQMYIKIENIELLFSGDCILLSPSKPTASLDYLAGKCISINSTFYETGNAYNDEYRAMLTATQTSGFEYAGELCVYGTGNDIPFADEAVSFRLEPFDTKVYRDMGGTLLGSFDAFGVIRASAGDYFVLIDSDSALIEPTGGKIAFYGALLPNEQAGEAQRVADESKQLMRSLYDGCDKTKRSVQEIVTLSGVPDWYPHWLMPKPTVDSRGWQRNALVNETMYNIYSVSYDEPSVSIDKVLENYMEQLAGSDGLEAYDDFEEKIADTGELGGAEATIFFTKGAYSIMINLGQVVFNVNVIVYIT